MRVEAILTPAEIAVLPQRDLRGATCVVFDVLRATSTMLTAFANGARRIFPVTTVEEALELKNHLPNALLGGERGGVRIDGFDLGNSPREYTPAAVSGRDIIATTTNGTLALRACADAGVVTAGAWLNLDALTAWLLGRSEAVSHLILVCAGTGKNFALEDGFVAGALLARLGPGGPMPEDDASQMLRSLHARLGNDPTANLRASENGRRLVEIGLGEDVDQCVATTRLPWVATLRAGALEGERIEPAQ